MFSLHGTGIGGGIVIGRARVLESRQRDVVRYRLQPGQADQRSRVEQQDEGAGLHRRLIEVPGAPQQPEDRPGEDHEGQHGRVDNQFPATCAGLEGIGKPLHGIAFDYNVFAFTLALLVHSYNLVAHCLYLYQPRICRVNSLPSCCLSFQLYH